MVGRALNFRESEVAVVVVFNRMLPQPSRHLPDFSDDLRRTGESNQLYFNLGRILRRVKFDLRLPDIAGGSGLFAVISQVSSA